MSAAIPAVPSAAAAAAPVPAAPVLSVQDLKAYFRTRYFGVTRDVRAVDGVELRRPARARSTASPASSSSGKTTLIKTIAGAIEPPLEVVGGTMTFSFLPGSPGLHRASPAELAGIRWRHLSYIMQGSMNVLNPVRRVRHSFDDFAFRHMGLARSAFWAEVEAHLARVELDPSVLAAYPHELSGGMRQRVTIALATHLPARVHHRRRADDRARRAGAEDVLGMIRGVQREIGSSLLFVTHDMGVHAP